MAADEVAGVEEEVDAALIVVGVLASIFVSPLMISSLDPRDVWV